MAQNDAPSTGRLEKLTNEELALLNVDEAWTLCNNDPAIFADLIDLVIVRVATFRGIPVPGSGFARKRIADTLYPRLEADRSQQFGVAVDKALLATLDYAPVPDDIIAAYNQARTCADKRTLCHAPATSMYIGRDGYVTACCYSRANPLGRYPEQSVSEIWFGEPLKKLRSQIDSDILPMGCDTCADQLRAGNFNGLLAGNFDALVQIPQKKPFAKLLALFGHTDAPVYPLTLEFELSNKCNLECAMCSGIFSSSIRANRERKPPLPQVFDSRFVEQLKPFIPHLQQAKFLGGEPFLIDIYYEIWELFIAANPSCDIIITTNGTVFTDKVRRVLEKLNCQIVVSLDSVEKATYEGIRVNATMERTLENLDKFMALNRRRGKPLSLAVCPMVKNWREIPQIVAFANTRGMSLFFNTVTFPENASLKYLSAPEHTRILEVFRQGLGTARNDLETRNYAALEDLCRQVELWKSEASSGLVVLAS